jgi:hypothetical protein
MVERKTAQRLPRYASPDSVRFRAIPSVLGTRFALVPILRRRRGRPPTDFEILKEIYRSYRDDYANHPKAGPRGRKAWNMVPIDLEAVAERLGVSAESVFGRLYYHLEPKYGDPPRFFFSPVVSDDRNCVNFPMVEPVLAGLWEQRRRDQLALWTAILSLGIAVASLVVSLVFAI